MSYNDDFQKAADERYNELQAEQNQWEIEEKKAKARDLMEGMQYLQHEQNQINEQQIIADEMQKIQQELGLSSQEQMQIQQALAQDPTLNEKAIRKSMRKRVDTILKGVRKRDPKSGQFVSQPPQSSAQQYQSLEEVQRKHNENRTAGTTKALEDMVQAVLPPDFWDQMK